MMDSMGMGMGMEIINDDDDDFSNNNNCAIERMGVGMEIIKDDNDNFSNNDNYFTPADATTNGIACNELLFSHCKCLFHYNFNIPSQSRPGICNFLFHHSLHIHWL